MSIPTLQQQQEELIRTVRKHENKAQDELARAAFARSALIAVNRKIMLAKKSTLKQGVADWHTFCSYMQ